jgi:hypothetical protein
MVDAVDSLLNNAVDFYVQAVDYCQISTSQIPTPVGAGIRQIKPKSGRSGRISSYSGQISSRLAGILAGSGLDLARTAGPPASGWIRLFWPETGQDGRLPVNWPGSGRFVLYSDEDHRNLATLPKFVYAKYKKIFLY